MNIILTKDDIRKAVTKYLAKELQLDMDIEPEEIEIISELGTLNHDTCYRLAVKVSTQ